MVYEHKFQVRNFSEILNFGGIKFVNNLFIKLLKFIYISNWNRKSKVEITSFSK